MEERDPSGACAGGIVSTDPLLDISLVTEELKFEK